MYKAALIPLRWRIVAKSCGVALFLINAGICVNYPANGQSKLRIAATVNDDMISILDIESRLSLSIYLSKLNNNQATRQRLAPQILRNIIDDRLKLQEIRKNKIVIQQAEIVEGIRQWEERSRLTKGGTTLLTQKLGIDKATIAEQVETQLGWIKLMRKLFLPSISFSEEEIEDIVSEELSLQGKPEFLVSEIFLPLNNNTAEMNAITLAERLTEQISAGAEFAAIARNFSQSPTAAVGGSLGWIRKLSLPAELKGAIESLEPGQVSEPIKTLEGIYILQLISKRLIEPLINRPKTVRSVMLQQIHFEVPAESSTEIWASIKDKAQKISSKASSCDDMDALGNQFGSPQSGSSGKVEISQLSSTIQKALRGLPLEQASKLIKISDGFLSIMICQKDQEKAQKITKIQFQNKIINQLMNERINLAAQQYLRGLRRNAVIDIRL